MAEPVLIALSPDDIPAFKAAIEAMRDQRNSKNRADPEAPVRPRARTYLARAPSSGIAANDTNLTGTGTGLTDDVLSYADCQIYKATNTYPGATGTRSVEKVVGFTQRVHNPWPTAVSGYSLFLAVCDEYGTWLVASDPGGASGGGSAITVKAADGTPNYANVGTLEVDEGTGTGIGAVSVTQPSGAGTARVTMNVATKDNAGLVSIFTSDFQDMGKGPKRFGPGGTGGGELLGVRIDGYNTTKYIDIATGTGEYIRMSARTSGGVGAFVGTSASSAGQFMVLATSAVYFTTSQSSLATGTTVYAAAYGVIEGGSTVAGLAATTRTVKDGAGNNKVVTIKGGIITGWET